MGYYTEYYLNLDTKEDEKISKNRINEINLFVKNLNNDEFFDLQDIITDNCIESKWYDHDVDMLFLSNEFKDVMFTLKGIGEEYDDVWEKTYFGGEITDFHKAEMINQFKTKEEKERIELSAFQYIFSNTNKELYYLLNVNFDKLDADRMSPYAVTSKNNLERWLKKHEHYINSR